MESHNKADNAYKFRFISLAAKVSSQMDESQLDEFHLDNGLSWKVLTKRNLVKT